MKDSKNSAIKAAGVSVKTNAAIQLPTDHLRRISNYAGIYSRVARQINSNASHVRRVAIGERKSARILHALEEEIRRIEQPSPFAQKVEPSSCKLRVRLRGTFDHAGSVYVEGEEGLLIRIGRDSRFGAIETLGAELESEFPVKVYVLNDIKRRSGQ